MDSPVSPIRPRRQLWPWFVGLCLAPAVGLAAVVLEVVTLDRDAATLRRELMPDRSVWQTQVQCTAGGSLLGTARVILGCLDHVPPEARQALQAVKSASVGVYRRARGSADRPSGSTVASLDATMHRRGWTRLVGVVEDRETVMIYGLTDGGNSLPGRFCIAVCEPHQLVVVSARIDPDALADLVSSKLLSTLPHGWAAKVARTH